MPPADHFHFDVFLSYNRAQEAWTRDLARRLMADQFRVWFDEFELPRQLGRNWIDLLVEGVNESRKIILVWSPEFFANDWPEFESTIIQHLDPVGRQQRIIPILHTSCDIPRKWAFRQALDFSSALSPGVEFEFRYQQLLYNIDNSLHYTGDFERFKKEWPKRIDQIPRVSPLPKGSRMPHAPSPLFVGRDAELRELSNSLMPASLGRAGIHAAVTGIAGVGKTQLAIEYVHRYGYLYRGGVYWLNMSSPENAMNEVALCGGPEGMNLRDLGDQKLLDKAETVHHIWEDGAVRLIVFDNVEETTVLEKWRPKTGRCSLLLSSRRREWPSTLSIKPLCVETLPRQQSLQFLGAARPAIGNDTETRHVADEICAKLGDLPLALAAAVAYLSKYKNDPLEDYLEALRSHSVAPDHEPLSDVWAVFTVSYEKLKPENYTDLLAIKLFYSASFFAPTSISRLLIAAANGLHYSERRARHQIDDAIVRLRDLGLIAESTEGRISLHRLLREFARFHATPGVPSDNPEELVCEVLLQFAQQHPRDLALEAVHLTEAVRIVQRRVLGTSDQEESRKRILRELFRLTFVAREILTTVTPNVLSVRLLVLDEIDSNLVTIAAGTAHWNGNNDFELKELGVAGVRVQKDEGVAGQSFKANQIRLFSRPRENHHSPYLSVSESDAASILAIPLRSPFPSGDVEPVLKMGTSEGDEDIDKSVYCYGVLGFSSTDANSFTPEIKLPELAHFSALLNTHLLKILASIVLPDFDPRLDEPIWTPV